LPSGQTGLFTAGTDYTANGKSYGVVTTTLANFVAEGTSFGGIKNGSSDAATFVIITGDATGAVLPTLNYSDPKVIYDFVSSSSLTVNNTFNGTILAPLASFTTNATVNGTMIVNALNNLSALSDTNAFTGDLSGLTNFTYNARVPEPASIALLSSGVAGVAWLRRKRKK
jgi:choice-of-anchor A domain-containing protein